MLHPYIAVRKGEVKTELLEGPALLEGLYRLF